LNILAVLHYVKYFNNLIHPLPKQAAFLFSLSPKLVQAVIILTNITTAPKIVPDVERGLLQRIPYQAGQHHQKQSRYQ